MSTSAGSPASEPASSKTTTLIETSSGGAFGLLGGVFGAISGELSSFAKSLKEENQATIERILPPKDAEPGSEPPPEAVPPSGETSLAEDSNPESAAADPAEIVVSKVTAGFSAVSGALSSFWAVTAEKAASLIGPEEPQKPDLTKALSSTSLGLSMKWEDEEDVPLGTTDTEQGTKPEPAPAPAPAPEPEDKKEAQEVPEQAKSEAAVVGEEKKPGSPGEDWAAWN